jgi:hypothetical protein
MADNWPALAVSYPAGWDVREPVTVPPDFLQEIESDHTDIVASLRFTAERRGTVEESDWLTAALLS